MDGLEKTVHFLYGVGHEYSLEVIAVFQAAAYTGGNGIYIFEYRAILNTGYIITDGGLDE